MWSVICVELRLLLGLGLVFRGQPESLLLLREVVFALLRSFGAAQVSFVNARFAFVEISFAHGEFRPQVGRALTQRRNGLAPRQGPVVDDRWRRPSVRESHETRRMRRPPGACCEQRQVIQERVASDRAIGTEHSARERRRPDQTRPEVLAVMMLIGRPPR